MTIVHGSYHLLILYHIYIALFSYIKACSKALYNNTKCKSKKTLLNGYRTQKKGSKLNQLSTTCMDVTEFDFLKMLHFICFDGSVYQRPYSGLVA